MLAGCEIDRGVELFGGADQEMDLRAADLASTVREGGGRVENTPALMGGA